MSTKSAFSLILKEVNQDHELRKPLLKKIQQLRDGRALISFFISFNSRTGLSQADADQIEELLINSDTSKGISLILDAPGGDGLAAERIIQICRSYCGKDFETIIPSRAKSAATMICLGSDKIVLSPTSELGPIDPQVPILNDNEVEWVASYHFTKTYQELLERAINLQNIQRIEPLLQQLQNFKAYEIHRLELAQKLSENIAISSLQKGMMKGKSVDEIKVLIQPFIDPEKTMSHGRALNHEALNGCQLSLELVELNSELWKVVWSLYMRSTFLVNRHQINKLIETPEVGYQA